MSLTYRVNTVAGRVTRPGRRRGQSRDPATRTASRPGRLQAHANTATRRHGGEAPATVATGAQRVGWGERGRAKEPPFPAAAALRTVAGRRASQHAAQHRGTHCRAATLPQCRNTATAPRLEGGGEDPATAVTAAPGGRKSGGARPDQRNHRPLPPLNCEPAPSVAPREQQCKQRHYSATAPCGEQGAKLPPHTPPTRQEKAWGSNAGSRAHAITPSSAIALQSRCRAKGKNGEEAPAARTAATWKEAGEAR